MSEQSVLKKTVFGGFNKKDVIAYIEQLQARNVALMDEIDSRDARIAELAAKADENASLAAKLASAEQGRDELSEKLTALDGENGRLKASVAALEAQIASAAEEETGIAQERCTNLIKDASRYSESLVEAAKQTAADILSAAKDRINSAASDINQANDRARTAQNNLSQSMLSVQDSVDAMLNVLGDLGSELTSGE